jgi:hypothetical protein
MEKEKDINKMLLLLLMTSIKKKAMEEGRSYRNKKEH